MTIKLGSRTAIAGKQYEVTSIRPNGAISLRPVKPGTTHHGTTYSLGEKVRVVEFDSLGRKTTAEGVIVSLDPVRAKVGERLVNGGKCRKWQ